MHQLLQHAYSGEISKVIPNRRFQHLKKDDQIADVLIINEPKSSGNTPNIDPIEIKVIQTLNMTPMGSVSKVIYRRKNYILKERNYSELGKGKSVMHEFKIFEKVSQSCKYIVRLEGYFKKERSICMLLEEASNGDLHSIIQRRKTEDLRFEENEILSIIVGIAEALKEIHSKQVIHRDLKSLNVFIDSEGSVKVGDFGISRALSNETMYVQTYSLGTPLYLSSEVIENRPYNEKVDIWALGIILYELLTCGEYPFEGNGFKDLMHKISVGTFHVPSHVISKYSSGLINLLHHLLRKDFSRRPSAKEVIDICKLLGYQNDVNIVEPLNNPSAWREKHQLSQSKFTTGKILNENSRIEKKQNLPSNNPNINLDEDRLIFPSERNKKEKIIIQRSPTIQTRPSPILREDDDNDRIKRKDLVLRDKPIKQELKQNIREWPNLKQETFRKEIESPQLKIIPPKPQESHNSLKDKIINQNKQENYFEQQENYDKQNNEIKDIHSIKSTPPSKRDQRWEARYMKLKQLNVDESNNHNLDIKNTPQVKQQEKSISEIKSRPQSAFPSDRSNYTSPISNSDQFYRKSINNPSPKLYEPTRRTAPNQNAGSRKYNILLGGFC